MEKNEKTVNEKLDALLEGFETSQEKKKFKLPLGVRMQKGKIKKNYCIVQIIRTNGSIEFKMVLIEDNTIKVGDVYHEATAKYVLRYRNYPLIILPEWNITPISSPEEEAFSPEKNLAEAVKEGKLSAAEKFILHAIKMDLVREKPKMDMTKVLIILGVIGAGLFLASYMGLFN